MAKSPAKRKHTDSAAAVAKLKKLFASKRNDLAWHHEFGRLVDVLTSERKYRASKINELVELLSGKKSQAVMQLLYAARDFSQTYPKRELGTLKGLSFTHVRKLLTVKDEKRRDWYRQQCQKNNWSFRQLDAKVKEIFGKRSQGGRPFAEVKVAPREALSNMLSLRDMWQSKCAPKLEQNLERLAKRINRRQPDDELVSLVDAGCTALDALCAAVQDARTKLRKVKGTRKLSR